MSVESRFRSHIDLDGPPFGKLGRCHLWTACRTEKGYGQLNVGNRRIRRAHRVAWELANGPIPDGLQVLHHCDNPPCVNVDHLFLGNNGDNRADMVTKGRGCRGTGHPAAKLNAGKVRAIRAAHATGKVGYQRLACWFNVDLKTIASIVRRKTWQHVE